MTPGDYDEDGQPVRADNLQGNQGSASIQSTEARRPDAVQRLREVVAEVTGGRIPAPQRRGPRF